MLNFLKKLLGSSNDAELKKLNKIVDAVEALEDEYRTLTDAQLLAANVSGDSKVNAIDGTVYDSAAK